VPKDPDPMEIVLNPSWAHPNDIKLTKRNYKIMKAQADALGIPVGEHVGTVLLEAVREKEKKAWREEKKA